MYVMIKMKIITLSYFRLPDFLLARMRMRNLTKIKLKLTLISLRALISDSDSL